MSAGQIGAAVVAVAIAAAAIWRRERLGRERFGVALAAALALAVYASGLLSLLPNPEEVIADLAGTLGRWTYLLVGALAFLETGAFIGFLAPGEVAVILGGVIAGQGEIAIVPLVGLVWACSLGGDSVSWWIGRRLGRGFLLRHGGWLRIDEKRLGQVEGYFARHGGKTIVIGRFLGFVRPLAPFVAGSSRVPFRRFFPYSVLGTGLWSTTFCLLGYAFWRSFDRVTEIAGRATLAFGLLVALTVGLVVGYRRIRRTERWRRMAALPPVAFVRNRLTPGELGIEFTTALSLAAGGLYVFGLYAVTLGGDPGLTPGDRMSGDIAGELRLGTAVDVVKVATHAGSFPVTGGLVLLAAVLLAIRRRPAELLTLVAGMGALYVAVHEAKAGIDRPRPEGALVTTDGSSYPSGHAAYATAYVALAVVAARVLPGLASRAALVGACVAVAAGVGVSRVYLRVHYWSDVAGGWALGAGVFGLCAAIALLVVHIRQNETARV